MANTAAAVYSRRSRSASAQLRLSRKPLRDRLVEGEWIVVFFGHDRPKCQEELPKYEVLARRSAFAPDAPRGASIEIPPYWQLAQAAISAWHRIRARPVER